MLIIGRHVQLDNDCLSLTCLTNCWTGLIFKFLVTPSYFFSLFLPRNLSACLRGSLAWLYCLHRLSIRKNFSLNEAGFEPETSG